MVCSLQVTDIEPATGRNVDVYKVNDSDLEVISHDGYRKQTLTVLVGLLLEQLL